WGEPSPPVIAQLPARRIGRARRVESALAKPNFTAFPRYLGGPKDRCSSLRLYQVLRRGAKAIPAMGVFRLAQKLGHNGLLLSITHVVPPFRKREWPIWASTCAPG